MTVNYDPRGGLFRPYCAGGGQGRERQQAAACAYETARNAKIAGEGLNYAQTHVYTQEAGRPRHYYTATDQSGYIGELYDAARSRALSALEGAYDAQIAALDSEAAALPAAYRAAKNAAAGDAAVERRNMDESFAAAGLNSGAAGQARLAISTELLGSLSALDAEKAARAADISARRTAAMSEYRSAIASAIAQNETERARALYEEAVRVDESYREAEQEMELQESYLAVLPEITAAVSAPAVRSGGGGMARASQPARSTSAAQAVRTPAGAAAGDLTRLCDLKSAPDARMTAGALFFCISLHNC